MAAGTAVLAAPWIAALLYPGPRTALAAIGSFVIPVPVFVAVVVHRSHTPSHSPTASRREPRR